MKVINQIVKCPKCMLITGTKTILDLNKEPQEYKLCDKCISLTEV